MITRRRAALLGITGLGLGLIVPAATLAQPSSISGQQAQIAQLQNQLNAINYQADAAVNNYDGAMWRLQTAKQQITQNTAAIKSSTQRLGASEAVLATRLRELYATPQPNAVQVLLSGGNITAVVDTVTLVQHIGNQNGVVVAGVRNSLNQLKGARVSLIAAQKSATTQVAAAAQQRTKVLSLLSQQKQVLAGAQASLRTALAQQAAAQARASALRAQALAASQAQQANTSVAASQATTSGGSSGGSGGGSTPVSLPSGSGNAAAVTVAERYIGVPYVWGGESPSGFDCSGLVAYAYAQIGISMAHYTVAQYGSFPKVPLNALQPGDIVFFYGFAHEAMYIGNGWIIQAPHTGAFVENTPVSAMPTPDGAVRP